MNAESQHPFSMFKYIIYIKNNVIYWIPYGDPNLGKRSVIWKKAVLRKYCGSNNTIVFLGRYYCVTTGITNALLPALVMRYYCVTLTLGVTPRVRRVTPSTDKSGRKV